jgi:hypothetical protein
MVMFPPALPSSSRRMRQERPTLLTFLQTGRELPSDTSHDHTVLGLPFLALYSHLAVY